jgi:excisionase family DNA binding protein
VTTVVKPNGQTLTVAEVAADLHVSKMTVYRLIREDELLGVRVGRSIRIPRQAYARYLRAIGAI